MHRADLIVGMHQRNQGAGSGGQEFLQLVEINSSPVVHPEHFDGNSLFFNGFQRMKHTMMFDRRTDNPLHAEIPDRTLDGHIIAFSTAGGEENFPDAGIEVPGYFFPGFFDGCPHFASFGMNTRRVAVLFPHQGGHRFNNFRAEWGSGGVVKVDAHWC